MTDAEIVFIPARGTGGPRQKYHTNSDCEWLKRAKNTYEKPLDVLDDALEECSFCSGDYERAGACAADGYAHHLDAVAPEEIGLSPRGERP